MTIYIGADHRGFQLKEKLKAWLTELGFVVEDCGNTQYDPEDDYADFTLPVATKVAADTTTKGIVVCGSGVGVTIAANKVKGVRAAAAFSIDEVRHGRVHDGINVLALAADYTTFEDAQRMVDTFLKTAFGTEPRFIRRVQKIEQYEQTGQITPGS